MKTDLFQSCGHCWVFQICWHIEYSTFTASSFRIWNSATGIPSPPLALFIVMFPKTHLTSHSRMSSSRWVITPWFMKIFFVQFFYVFFPSLLIFCFCWFHTISVLYWANLCIKCSLGISNSLEEITSLPHSIVFLSCTDHWGRLSYLSLLFFGTPHWNGHIYHSFSPLLFSSLLFTAICKASSDSHFAFLLFCFLVMVLIPVSCTMTWTSIHSSSGTLSLRSSPLNLFLTSTI